VSTAPHLDDALLEDEPGSLSFPWTRPVEAWLEGLNRNETPEPEDCRILFVVDNDFGEFTLVMYFILGQKCFRNARILLSPRLYKRNSGTPDRRLAMWTSEQDLAENIATWRPRVVVFASAYLFPIHDLLSSEAVGRLCDLCRRVNAVVVTADPLLGLLSQWSTRGLERLISIDIPPNADQMLLDAKRIADAKLHRVFSETEKILRAAPHLYPSYTEVEGLDPATSDIRNICFFNEALLLPPHIQNGPTVSAGPPAGDGSSHWMFTISEADVFTQSVFMGRDAFIRNVADLLTQTAQLGRHALLLAPTEILQLVARVLVSRERIHLLPFCSFIRAMSLLLSAEYSFYWNVVSHSILMQLWNGKPVVLFNRGHLARAAPALYERVIAWYYQGWEPSYLNHTAPLSLSALENATAPYVKNRDNIMARFRRAPSPAGVFHSLLDHAGRPERERSGLQ